MAVSIRLSSKSEDILHKIDSHGAGKGAISPPIGDVAPIVWQSPLDIVIHAPSRAEDAIGPPPTLVVEGIGVMLCGFHLVGFEGEEHGSIKEREICTDGTMQ